MKELLVLLTVCSSIFAKHVTHNESSLKKINDLDLEDFGDLLKSVNELSSTSLETEAFGNLIPDGLNLSDISNALLQDHPHAHLSVKGIIDLSEYKSEIHKVKTEDGYILELHRITGNKTHPSPVGKPLVFLMHGMLASSSDWVLTGPKRGLAFLLADAGYDVWMGNARGNRYSRKHESFNVKKKDFWQFTWHEIGIFDLPVMIDYALNVTENKDLVYIGHSQGSTSFFVMLSERPEYNDKIKVMFSLAPVAYCSNMYSPFYRFAAKYEKLLRLMTNPLGPWEVLPNRGLYKMITSVICKGSINALCRNALFLLSGFNKDQMDMAVLPAITAHFPAGSSIHQLLHYGQLINSGHFRQYNKKIIGTSNPPSYNLDNVKVPISLHYSYNDWLSDEKDVKKLHNKLPNSIGLTPVPLEKFNHFDFLYAIDVKTLLYDDIMEKMNDYKK